MKIKKLITYSLLISLVIVSSFMIMNKDEQIALAEDAKFDEKISFGAYPKVYVGNKLKLYKKHDSPQEAVSAYHSNVNALFNEKRNVLINNFDDEKMEFKDNEKLLNTPNDKEDHYKWCNDNRKKNASTYCLGIEANLHLAAIKLDLNNRTKDLRLPDKCEDIVDEVDREKQREAKACTDLSSMTMKEAREYYRADSNFINETLEQIDKTLNISLQTYENFKFYYVIHKQQEEMIDKSITLRGKLIDLRKVIEVFPGKFINATTAECQ